MNPLISTWKHFLKLGLEEDSAVFDWTARAVSALNSQEVYSKNKASLIAKSDGVWAGEVGLQAIELLSAEMGSPIKIQSLVKNKETLAPQQKICEWSGNANTLLIFERTFINLAAYASGIATQTQALVKIIESKKISNPIRLTPTRKTLPAYRDLAIESAILGGAYPHRLNLSGGLLIKENHIAAAGGIVKIIHQARKTAPHGLKIEIEVRNLKELQEALTAGADIVLLDNFSPALIKEAVAIKPKEGVLYEASGGISESNISEYVIEGLDVISVGSITHSVKSVDLSLLMNSV